MIELTFGAAVFSKGFPEGFMASVTFGVGVEVPLGWEVVEG